MKTTITLGIINDKHVVLKDPSVDAEDHVRFIRALTTNGGEIKSGKSTSKVYEAVVLHSVKGVIKRRVFA